MISFTYSGDLSELSYYGWDSNFLNNNGSIKKEISEGTHTYYIKNAFGDKSICSINVTKTVETKTCDAARIRDLSSGTKCNAYNGYYLCEYSEVKDRCNCRYSGFANGSGGFYCCPDNYVYPSGAFSNTFYGPDMSLSLEPASGRPGCYMEFSSAYVNKSYSCSSNEYIKYDDDWCYK